MNKLYHLTTAKNAELILKEGLKCCTGERSKLVKENRPGIYLTDIDSLPYWQLILDVPIILEVKNIQQDNLEKYDYHSYSEYIYSSNISSENINSVTMSYDVSKYNCRLSLDVLDTISDVCVRCAQYYNDINKLSDYEKNDYIKGLKHLLVLSKHLLNRIDLFSCKREVVTEHLIGSAEDGEYTLCDEYKHTGLRLYEQLIHYRHDELTEHRKALYEKCIEKFPEYINNINTGIWGV